MSLASALLKRLFVHHALGIPWKDIKFGRKRDPKHGKPVALLPLPQHGPASVEFNISHQAGLVALVGCRTDELNAELGVDIIKVAYPGPQLMRAWTTELGVPLVILGGPRSGNPEDVLALAGEAISHGARGIVIGRNVWQREREVTRRLIRSLQEILHGDPGMPGAAALSG